MRLSIVNQFVVFFCLISFPIAAQTNQLLVYQNEHLNVSVTYLSKADFSIQNWIGVTFTNVGKDTIFINYINYRLDRFEKTVGNEDYWNYGGYGSGNIYSLFEYFWDKCNASEYRRNLIIQPGDKVVCDRHISDYATVMIENPFVDSISEVQTRFEVEMEYEINNEKTYFKSQVPFSFEWKMIHTLTENALLKRFEDALSHYYCSVSNAYLIERFLEHFPDITRQVPIEKVVSLVQQSFNAQCASHWYPRNKIAESIIVKDSAARATMVQFLLQRLKSQNFIAEDDLNMYWDTVLIEPLLAKISTAGSFSTLWLFDKHYDTWKLRTEVSPQLLTFIKHWSKTAAYLHPGSCDWINDINYLPLTHDTEVLAYYMTSLKDTSSLCKEYLTIKLDFYEKKPSCHRVCDMALEAIYKTLGRDIQSFYWEGAKKNKKPFLSFDSEIHPVVPYIQAIRDELIRQLLLEFEH